MIEQRYKFPGGLNFALETDDPAAASFFDAEYGWARGRAEGGPVLALHWSRARWAPRVPGGTQHVHKLLARWSYRIELEPDRIELDVSGNRWALPMVHHMLVHHGLRYLAAQKGWLVLHAAALEWQGSSVLFTGPGGAGKTTASSLLLAHGDVNWRHHADDYVFIEPSSGRSHAYPTRAHLYADVLAWAPSVAEKLTRGERMRIKLLSELRRWSGDRIKWPTRVALERLWPKRGLAAEARLGALLILERGEVNAPTLAPVEAHAAVETLVDMNFQEARHFVNLFEKAGVWPDEEEDLEGWRQLETQALRKLVQERVVRRLRLPKSNPDSGLGPALEAAALRALAEQEEGE